MSEEGIQSEGTLEQISVFCTFMGSLTLEHPARLCLHGVFIYAAYVERKPNSVTSTT